MSRAGDSAYQRGRDQGEQTLRSSLLDVAGSLLADGGSGALTMRRLAEAPGCSMTVLYRLFAGKDGVVRGLYREGFDRLRVLALLAVLFNLPGAAFLAAVFVLWAVGEISVIGLTPQAYGAMMAFLAVGGTSERCSSNGSCAGAENQPSCPPQRRCWVPRCVPRVVTDPGRRRGELRRDRVPRLGDQVTIVSLAQRLIRSGYSGASTPPTGSSDSAACRSERCSAASSAAPSGFLWCSTPLPRSA